jgi:hypothetical protein
MIYLTAEIEAGIEAENRAMDEYYDEWVESEKNFNLNNAIAEMDAEIEAEKAEIGKSNDLGLTEEEIRYKVASHNGYDYLKGMI